MEKGFQLRNYHVRRGKDKDNTPLYPITKAENIIGDVGGVTQVTELPTTGEEGKIYYDTTEKKYYTYTSEDGFSEIGTTAMPHGEAPENISELPSASAKYVLKPNTYYDFDEFYTTDTTVAPLHVIIKFDDINNNTVANSYVFRMTVPTTGVMNMTILGVIITDSAKEILDNLENGHRYEFNIFDKVMLVTDVTSTPDASNG